MIYFLIRAIDAITKLIVLLVIASVVLSYFVSPYHQVRQTLDRLVEPMLMPIRSVLPLVGNLDFSPLVFILLVQFLSSALMNFLLVLI